MEKAQRPRGECPIVKLTRESCGGWGVPSDPSGGVGAGVSRKVAGLHEKIQREGRRGFVAGLEAVERGGRGEEEEEGGEKRLRFGIVVMCDEGMWPEE